MLAVSMAQGYYGSEVHCPRTREVQEKFNGFPPPFFRSWRLQGLTSSSLRKQLGKSPETVVLEPHPLWNCDCARAKGVEKRAKRGPLGSLVSWMRKLRPLRVTCPKSPYKVIREDRARVRPWQALPALRPRSKLFEGKGVRGRQLAPCLTDKVVDGAFTFSASFRPSVQQQSWSLQV